MAENGLFRKMCQEAIEEISSGEKGWKEVETNTLLMACFGLLENHMTHKIARPLWWFAGSVCVGAITYLVSSVIKML